MLSRLENSKLWVRFFSSPLVPVAWFVVFAVLAGLCFQSQPSTSSTQADLTEVSFTPNAASSKYVTKPIREAQLLEWVLADNPLFSESLPGDFGEVERATWRIVKLRMFKRDGVQLHIELARPLHWLEQYHVRPAATIFLDMEEMGAKGEAEILSILECPPIQPRPSPDHRLITGKFVHSSGDFLNLYVQGLPEPINPTVNHPFWSEDRQEFIRADKLKVAERLRLADGRRTYVLSVSKRSTTEPAYNIEVDGEHVYCVSSIAVLVHNNNADVPKERTLWRAPPKKNTKPDSEVIDGFGPDDYPGEGAFFGTRREVAEEFQQHGPYQNGIQEINISEADYQRLLEEGKIKPDGWMPKGDAVHIKPDDLPDFNEAIKQGTPNIYHPQGGG